jgi:hypothetical protein
VRADLAQYSTNLVGYIRTNPPAGGLADVLGGFVIVPANLGLPGASNPNQAPNPTPADWTTIPGTTTQPCR